MKVNVKLISYKVKETTTRKTSIHIFAELHG